MNQCSGRVSPRRGFTLVETVISMGILFVAGLGVVASILYTRRAMELNKQELTAMNNARRIMEASSTNSGVDETSSMIIMRFNDPGLDVPATVEHLYFPIRNTGADAGTVDWDNPLSAPLLAQPTYSRVTISWNSLGSGRRHAVTASGIVTKGVNP